MTEIFFSNENTSFALLLRREIKKEFEERGRKKKRLSVWFFGGIFFLFVIIGLVILLYLSNFPFSPSREVITKPEDPLSFGSLLEKKFFPKSETPFPVSVSEEELSRLLEGFLQYYPQKFMKSFYSSSSDVILEPSQIEMFFEIREPINFRVQIILNNIRVTSESLFFHLESIRIGKISLPLFFNKMIAQYLIEPKAQDFFERLSNGMDFEYFRIEHKMILVDRVSIKSSFEKAFEEFHDAFIFEVDEL